ncbi:fimbrillin family protein [Bacteroides faecium]|uniref:Fimbrillin family protein n=1 Tax=Bacteroides faecium TaxID=2715212 RepID=A0A6H0KKT1_9BACE|nr:fimbrillin family protein [Bacteroides faecium]QIU93895.1 fimbrillin family protein [Bacteroides faecium]
MKLGKFLSMGVLSVFALGACTPNADDNSEWNDGSQPVVFKSQIQGVKTRAVNNAWSEDGSDQVGVFVKQNGAFGDAVNKHYYVSAEGNLSTASADDAIYYPDNGDKVDFVAYYPYATTLAGNAYTVDVTEQSSQPAIDLLYSINATNKDKSVTAPVQLTFKHQLAKIVLNITKDATIPTLEGLKVAVTGTKTKGSFALLNGVLTPDDNSVQNIAAKVSNAGTLAETIILPVNGLSGAAITFTIGDKTKSWNIPEGQNYVAGSQYTYPVVIKETGGQISVSFGDATIDDWTPVTGGNIDIDFGNGGGVDPTPGGEEKLIFTETFGAVMGSKPSGGWPYVSKFTAWSNPWTFTDKTSTMSIRSIDYKTESNPNPTDKVNNLWVPAAKNSTLEISSINTEGYTKMKFGFELAADSYNFTAGTKISEQELNVLRFTWNGQDISIPSKIVTSANSNVFFPFEIATDLVGTANSVLEISTTDADNKAGLRVANIKIFGTK